MGRILDRLGFYKFLSFLLLFLLRQWYRLYVRCIVLWRTASVRLLCSPGLRKQHAETIFVLRKKLKRFPQHIGVVLAENKLFLSELANLVVWSLLSGVPYLSIYDPKGMVKQGEVIEKLQEQVISTQHEYLGRDYQLYKVVFHEEKDTPKRNGLLNGHTGSSKETLYLRLLDNGDSRGDIINTARHLCSQVKEGKLDVSGITVDEFGQHLSSSLGFPEVDLVLKFGIREEKKEMPDIQEVKGDLFSCPESTSLAHCISADIRMGKGIAAIFKKKFAGVSELQTQKKSVGEVAILKRGDRHVYYLITKAKYFEKPTYAAVEKSLNAMKKHCEEHGVKALAMPRIGCGLDGLEWKQMNEIIEKVFQDSSLDVITIYTL
ncbi:unnamed protein product [Darwinula stevensoni]|uniref:Macro domain-containing protein n=1 Tax=Darwinula stevensoni TaxID=69355 RepID=A0A7R8XBF7_9CRUS|nr:unnamed protein product [Darwinula stevensoni]CAG0887714.1 unnamed protein product [Darwinula stevensoni]